MTQERLGQELERLTGRVWSMATISAMERTADGVRIRQFDADELIALTLALDVPLLFLFLPANPNHHPALRYTPRPVREQEEPGADSLTAADVVAAIMGAGDAAATVGAGDATALLHAMLSKLLGGRDFPSADLRSQRLARWRDALEEVTGEVEAAISNRKPRRAPTTSEGQEV